MVRFTKKFGIKKGPKRKYKKKSVITKPISNLRSLFRCKIAGKAELIYAGTAATQFVTFNVMLNFPTITVNRAGTYGQLANGDPFGGTNLSSSWTKLIGATSLFEMYKVNSLRVIIDPLSMSVQGPTTSWPASGDNEGIYVYNDPDDPALLTSEQNALNNGLVPKSFFDGKRKRYSYIQPKAHRGVWFNCQQYNAVPTANTTNQNQNGYSNPYGAMKIAINTVNGAVANAHIGTIYMFWDCTFKGIRDIQ